jgi:hypothetical protein
VDEKAAIDERRLDENAQKLVVGGGEDGQGERGKKMRKLSKWCFGGLMCLVLGSWVAYFWGVATGSND